MIHYIIQTIAFQLVFLIIYDVFLKKETFFNWNRIYLLSTALLSLILPFVKVDSFKNVVSQNYIVSFPKLAFETQTPIVLDEVVLQGVNTSYDMLWYISAILILGCALALLYFLYRIISIVNLIYKNPKTKQKHIRIVQMLNSSAAFSFFNYVFLGEKIDAQNRESILKHELVHINQKHTLDLLFFELLRIVFWFNPFVYMYQNRTSDLHEFIADSKAVKHNKKQYYENLLSQVFDTKAVSFINPFFKQSLIKKRIIMLQKSKSKQYQLLKYALLIPMVLGMLVYSSCSDESNHVKKQDELNLSQYSYSLKKGEELVGAKKEIHNNYEAFLKNNPEYVAWAQISSDESEITYSVHSKLEEIPEGLTRTEVSSSNGSYLMYTNLHNSNHDRPESGELLNKIDAVKEQIEVQGNISDKEEKGIELLFDMLTLDAESVNQKLIEDVQNFNNAKNKSELHQRISDLFLAVQEQGDMSVEEELSLKTLLTLVSKAGLNSSFYEEVKDRIEIPFAIIDKVPEFPNSKTFASQEESKVFFNNKLNMFVGQNFNTELANTLKLSGVQKISVFFKIGHDGQIKDIKARASHPKLEAEAIRVVSMLPTMVPGEQNGKQVTVPYYLPIKFEVK